MSECSQLGLHTPSLTATGEGKHDSPLASSRPRCFTFWGQPDDFPPCQLVTPFIELNQETLLGHSNMTGAGVAVCFSLCLSSRVKAQRSSVGPRSYSKWVTKSDTEDSRARSQWGAPCPARQQRQMNVDLSCQQVKP